MGCLYCRATYYHFIGVSCCHVRVIFILHMCHYLGISKYAWRTRLRRIHVLNVEGWSYVPLLKLFRICRCGREKLVVLTVIASIFLAYLLVWQVVIPSFVAWDFLVDFLFFDKKSINLFRIWAHLSLDICKNIFMIFLPLVGVPRILHRTPEVPGVARHSCDDFTYKTPFRHMVFFFGLILFPQTTGKITRLIFINSTKNIIKQYQKFKKRTYKIK